MVTFKLKHTDSHKLTFHYYPEGDEKSGHGTITVYIDEGRIDVSVLAQNDKMVRRTAVAMNRMRDEQNAMREFEQMPPFTEEEWPTATEDKVGTLYADYAIRAIVESYNNGEILKEGSAHC